MKKLLATVILFGLGTGLALAGDNNLCAYKTTLQVQSGNVWSAPRLQAN